MALIRFFAVVKKERVKKQSEEQIRMSCAATIAVAALRSRYIGRPLEIPVHSPHPGA